MIRFNVFKNTVLLFVLVLISCASKTKDKLAETNETLNPIQDETILFKENELVIGANRTEIYLPLLNEKRVGIVANQTSVIFKAENKYVHLVDSLLALKVDVKKVFAPEHGFRGKADAGEFINDSIDKQTGLPIVSFYGKNKKPSKAQLEGLDVLIFDIQDVGVRFYTYISSLHYIMEACAEQNISLIILDRPNPNGHYIDGPILEPEHKSFIGMHPIPVVHGMTIGEFAQMINGEKWLENGVQCDISIIQMKNYTHKTVYHLPIKPSPNLPNDKAINLYPSLCFFEGTNVSAGRGTEKQFQIYGSPFLPETGFSFTPQPNEGSKYPKHDGKVCHGYDLSQTEERLIDLNLSFLIDAYSKTEDKADFFIPFFTKLAGTETLQNQIENNFTITQIKASWTTGLEAYNNMRKAYLIYE
ncbi:exo-beta-N-acetylmuramidase NamZ domain-containing protein [Lacinutrix iliipiscaria]|uniref:Exo-beta-N-acetylmuramidase NamZ domain-containing protein n=1 Tax=Lacinutrix iliipiscaria TaxID=1230532 RepID=A0ABW5WRR7_9FLAO